MTYMRTMSAVSQSKIIPLRRIKSDQLDFEKHGFSFGNKIGCGAFATVNTAMYSKSTEQDKRRRVKLACKIIDQSQTSSDYLTKFLPRELEILTKIDHPNLIQVHSIFQRKQKIYIFMQNAECGDLFRFIRDNGVVKQTWTKYWFYQLASAIQYLHSINIAHRDLKCENILLSRHMNVKVSDFGFAKICKPRRMDMIELSRTFCGSIAYAAPEILMNQPYDPKRSDVWSMGVILFIMMFGSMPFDDSSFSTMIEDQKRRRMHVNPKIEMKLTRGCKRMLRSLLEPDLEIRIKSNEILEHKWLKKYVTPDVRHNS